MSAGEEKALKKLIHECCDAEEFYQEAAETTEDVGMRRLYNEMKDVHTPIIADLSKRVKSIGGTPEIDTTIIGDITSSFGTLKATLSTNTDTTLVKSLEDVEEDLLQHFYGLYKNSNELSDETRAILKHHIKMLKDAYVQMKEARQVIVASAAA